MRVIDRDKYARHLADIQLSYDGEVRDGIDIAFNALDKAPTIDAVEVVRCCDCVWFGETAGFYSCTRIYGFPIAPIKPNDYCSYGKREVDT